MSRQFLHKNALGAASAKLKTLAFDKMHCEVDLFNLIWAPLALNATLITEKWNIRCWRVHNGDWWWIQSRRLAAFVVGEMVLHEKIATSSEVLPQIHLFYGVLATLALNKIFTWELVLRYSMDKRQVIWEVFHVYMILSFCFWTKRARIGHLPS